mmetsp:Transcript_20373/g.33537  ORF Transcript_20373/g.33537 Transcript_20373/m.33537 type:complete len:465 (+) Transcript_20373:65-1459(+)
MMPLSLSSNHRKGRRRRRRCDYQLLCCSVALFLSSSITSIACVAKQKIDSHNYIIQHRRPALSLSLSTSSLLSVRGGSSSTSNNQQTQSLSKNNNNEKSPFEYIPITALNNYGQSTQLRHAMEAASRYGTPIIACLCCATDDEEGGVRNNDEQEVEHSRKENSIVICSLQRPRLGIVAPSIPIGASSTNIRRFSNKTASNKVHPSIQGLVKILATRDDVDNVNVDATTQPEDNNLPTHTLHTAIVSTGIQSDATFLMNQLQRHFAKFWFRYNTLPTSTLAVVKMIQEVLLDCMGYDWSEEVGSAKVSGGVGSAAPSYNENDDEDNSSSAAGRPLGLSSFLLSLANDDTTTASSSSAPRPTITLIEANGSSEQYVARAMGVGAQKANELLAQKWKRGMSHGEAREMMQEILREVAIERGWLPVDDDDRSRGGSAMSTELTVVSETLTTRGVDIEFLPLQNEKSRV